MKIVTIVAGGIVGYAIYTTIKAGLIIAGIESYRRQHQREKTRTFLAKTPTDNG